MKGGASKYCRRNAGAFSTSLIKLRPVTVGDTAGRTTNPTLSTFVHVSLKTVTPQTNDKPCLKVIKRSAKRRYQKLDSGSRTVNANGSIHHGGLLDHHHTLP